MKRNSGIEILYPGLYRHDRLEEKRQLLGLSLREVSRLSGVKLDSARRAFTGEAHQKQVWPICNLFGMDWANDLHDLPTEIHRAVSNENSKSRSVTKGRRVGAAARPLKRSTYTRA